MGFLAAVSRHSEDMHTVCPRQLAYAEIVDRVMTESSVSARCLAKNGIISERARKFLPERIIAGLITKAESDKINEYLNIDPIRLYIAIYIYNDPSSYFEQSTEMAATYSHEIGALFRENDAARSGDFGPIGGNLVRAHAQKLTNELAQHMKSVNRFREAPFG